MLIVGSLSLTAPVTLRGTAPGRDDVRIRPDAGIKALVIAPAITVRLEHLTLTGARLIGTGTLTGAAIQNAGNLALSDVAVTDNVITRTDAGGIPHGAGIDSTGPVTAEDSLFEDNVVRGGSIPQGGAINTAAALTIRRTTLRHNTVETITGGGIPQGGAINASFGVGTPPELRIEDSALTGNTVRIPAAGGIPQGAALITGSGPLDVRESLIADNLTSVGSGGAIAEAPLVVGDGIATFTDVTVSGNATAGAFSSASALRVSGSAPGLASATLTNVTVAQNAVSGSGAAGAFFRGAGDSITLRNTILASNAANGASASCPVTNPVTSGGHNLTDDATCAFAAPGDRSADPRLGPLQDNGGPTATHALLAGSPAIDAGTRRSARPPTSAA